VVADITLGQGTGYSVTSDEVIHAFVYTDGTMQDLGSLGGAGSLANAINAQGHVTGFALTSQGKAHAFLYSEGSMVDLGPAGTTSSGKAINSLGQIAGQATRLGRQTYALCTRWEELIRSARGFRTVSLRRSMLRARSRGFFKMAPATRTPSHITVGQQSISCRSCLQDLLALSAAVGPGMSLQNKAQRASAAYSAGDTTEVASS
jgi:probable HAF family extracellular repeat protein